MTDRRQTLRRSADREAYGQQHRLAFRPPKDRPPRWHPNDGEPLCVLEWLSQMTWQARRSIYIALVVTLTLLVQLFGLPWQWGWW